MRGYQRPEPDYGRERVVTRFLWWPKWIYTRQQNGEWTSEWRWLERATYRQRLVEEYLGDDGARAKWQDMAWVGEGTA